MQNICFQYYQLTLQISKSIFTSRMPNGSHFIQLATPGLLACFTILITLEVIINSPTVAGERSPRITHAKRLPRPRPRLSLESRVCALFLPVFISRLSNCLPHLHNAISIVSQSRSRSRCQSLKRNLSLIQVGQLHWPRNLKRQNSELYMKSTNRLNCE